MCRIVFGSPSPSVATVSVNLPARIESPPADSAARPSPPARSCPCRRPPSRTAASSSPRACAYSVHLPRRRIEPPEIARARSRRTRSARPSRRSAAAARPRAACTACILHRRRVDRADLVGAEQHRTTAAASRPARSRTAGCRTPSARAVISPVFASSRPITAAPCAVNHALPALSRIIVWGSPMFGIGHRIVGQLPGLRIELHQPPVPVAGEPAPCPSGATTRLCGWVPSSIS